MAPKTRVFLVVFLIMALVLGCESLSPGGSATKAPAAPTKMAATKGGVLRIGFSIDPNTLDPAKGTMGTDHNILFSMYDALVTYDTSLAPQPQLATSWETPDPKTYIFKLRKGVKFHDGTEFNADAVKFNVLRHIDPKSTSTAKGQVSIVDSIDVVDPYTVKFNLKSPSASFPMIMADRGGMIASPTAIQKLGPDFDRNPVGAGPYKLKKWVSDVSIELERFDDYWDKDKIYLDGMVYQVIKDVTTRTANLKSGAIDLEYMVPPTDVAGIEAAPNFVVSKGLTTEYHHIWLNLAKSPLENKALRQAMAYSLDTVAMVKGVYLGYGEPAYTSFPSNFWAYDAQLAKDKGYRRDMAKVKEKLKEGGKPDGFTFSAGVGNEEPFLSFAQAAKAQMAEANINMDLQVMDRAKLSDLMWNQRGIPASPSRWTGRADPDMTVSEILHSKGGFNAGNWKEPGLDEIIEQARASSDRAERKKLYVKTQEMMLDGVLNNIPLVFPQQLTGLTKKVQGYEVYADGKMHLRSVWLQK